MLKLTIKKLGGKKMQSSKTDLITFARKGMEGEEKTFKWTNLKYDKLEKGKFYALPIESDDIYFEVLEVLNVTKLTVKAVLYNWNKKGGEYPFANYLTIKKSAKDGVKITLTDSKILEKKELSQAPQVYCNAVSERMGYGKIKSKNSSEMSLIENYGIASEKGEDVKIKNIIVDKKTGKAKILMEFDEKKKQKKLFKHLFEDSKYSKLEKKKKNKAV